jgi:carbon-monoxide dehydrogenase large subunit
VRKSLAADKVRFVGDPVACVVAESAVQAKDAAEAVELDIEPLPAVALASEAARPGAPQLYDDVPGNVALDFLFGEPEKVAQAFENAFHKTRLTLRNTRVVVAAMEPRAAMCTYDAASGRFTLTAPDDRFHQSSLRKIRKPTPPRRRLAAPFTGAGKATPTNSSCGRSGGSGGRQ